MNGSQFWLLVALFSIIAYGWWLIEHRRNESVSEFKMRKFRRRFGKSIQHLSPFEQAKLYMRDEFEITIFPFNVITGEKVYKVFHPNTWALNARLYFCTIERSFKVETIDSTRYNQWHIKDMQVAANLLNTAMAEEVEFLKKKSQPNG